MTTNGTPSVLCPDAIHIDAELFLLYLLLISIHLLQAQRRKLCTLGFNM